MSVYVLDNHEFATLATFLVNTTSSEAIKAKGVKSIAHTLREANIQSFMGRYDADSYERDIINLSIESLPDAKEIFFMARNLVIESIEWPDYFKSEAKKLADEILRLSLCPAVAGGTQTFNVTVKEAETAAGNIIHNKGPFGGEGIIVGARREAGGYMLGTGKLSGLVWDVIKLDGSNRNFVLTQWHAESCEFAEFDLLPLMSVEAVEGLRDQILEQRLKDQKAREEAIKETQKQTEAFRAHCKTIMPEKTKAIIIANLVEDESDTMSDYHGSTTKKTILLAWSKHTRDIFSEMRKAAANHPSTAALKDAPDEAEHREKWSMGGGYYLKDGYRHSTGWEVRKVKLYDERSIPLAELAECLQPAKKTQAPTTQTTKTETRAQAPDTADGYINIEYNEEKNGVELRFQEKPEGEILESLRAGPFRYHRKGRFWYAKQSDKAEANIAVILGLISKMLTACDKPPSGKSDDKPAPESRREPATLITMSSILFG
ncbi:hypothetical protein HHX48_17550 [Salinimonas sp. HHU 13199]|uniref:Uncharacterized protein n=1 Tax=Salinimonas profundi TaxID=2729140 RepID=A0ABR8LSZ4_9ALTE|nr:hypothetical protein [Salinimonas profundi]MBD3587547.1 hypothetical protein [Salinimonas profundi]